MGSGFNFPIIDALGNKTSTVVDFADMFVRKELFTDGNLFAWGYGGAVPDAYLGLGGYTHRSSPVQVGTPAGVQWNRSITNGGGVTASGALWVWGPNLSGQLGVGDRTVRLSPVQVGTQTDWKQITKDALTSAAAIKTDGTLWAWGDNTSGQLGLIDQVHRSSPVQVGSLTNWKQIDVGSYYFAAVKTDGTLWVWGSNQHGKLGTNDNISYSSPVQVGTDTNWKLVSCGVSHTAAVKTDGTLWTWGYNLYGSLGLSDTVHRSSPVQVGTNSFWRFVECNGDITLAIRINGTLWGCGIAGNVNGNPGGVHRSSLTQIGSATNWRTVSTGGQSAAALKTDGTLWLWGANDYGQLGFGDLISRSSPVQLGASVSSTGSANWINVVSTDLYTFAASSAD